MMKILEPSQQPVFGEKNITNDHIWIDLSNVAAPFTEPAAALFLDRDGVIVVDTHYLSNPADVVLMSGAADLIRKANASDIPVVVVTNQSGIGRGYFDWAAFDSVQMRISAELAKQNAAWDAVIACPYHRDARPPFQHLKHPCRKPQPGMLIAAANLLNIDLDHSWIVGDKAGDVEAGKNAGIKGAVHVATHPQVALDERKKSLIHQSDQFDVLACNDVEEVWDQVSY